MPDFYKIQSKYIPGAFPVFTIYTITLPDFADFTAIIRIPVLPLSQIVSGLFIITYLLSGY